jgi:hypothetical protein
MFFRLPHIEIHTWGGLGSQLYALALQFELFERNPKRVIEMHLHTGGVTKRVSELDGVIDPSLLFYINDFSDDEISSHQASETSLLLAKGLTKRLRKIILLILLKTGFISRFDSDDQNLTIYPWSRQIRGHYSSRRIPVSVLKSMYVELLRMGFLNSEMTMPEHKGIHYRLGDLLVIGSKHPASIESLSIGIELANRLDPGKDCVVFSDSLDSACEMLSSLPLGLEYKPGAGNTWQAISTLVHIRIFVGTPSKVTEWVTIFRLVRDPDSCSIVPKSLKPMVERQFGNCNDFRNLFFY